VRAQASSVHPDNPEGEDTRARGTVCFGFTSESRPARVRACSGGSPGADSWHDDARRRSEINKAASEPSGDFGNYQLATVASSVEGKRTLATDASDPERRESARGAIVLAASRRVDPPSEPP
jgi:hypothetical protein